MIKHGDFMNQEKIGKLIKEQRMKLGLSQADLGEKVHVTRQAVSNWENGKTLPDKDILISLSKLFNVTINDILCAENLEDVALELVSENNKKQAKIKRLITIFSSIIILLLFSFLAFYFITNYNSIKVYKVSGTSDHFRIVDGIIISTAKKTYFKLGNLETKTLDPISINTVKLYYKDGKKEKVIFESETNTRLFVDKKGYNELYRNAFEKYKNKLYLEVSYNDDSKETIKLDLVKKFSNDNVVLIQENKVLKDTVKERIDFAIEKEMIDYQTGVEVRKEEPKPVINSEPVITQPVIVDNPIVQEQIVSEEQIPVEPIEKEPEVKEINYDEIKNIIETYGRQEFRTYILEYTLEDGSNVVISEFRNMINIEYEKNTIEKWTYSLITNNFFKHSYNQDDFELIEISNMNDEEQELFDRMNNYLMLVYQEIE